MTTNTSKDKQKKIELTEEQAIILGCWMQYSCQCGKNNKSRFAAGMSNMEQCESYLREHGIINSWGNPVKNIIW